MYRVILALCFILVCIPRPAATADEFVRLLPHGASVVVKEELDLTGDEKPELVVGYALPRQGLPPTLGQAVAIERDASGRLRSFPLAGMWPGHYPPSFQATDLTGDGRPELVEQVAGGGAWGTLRIFRRAAESYELLLEDNAQDHVLWDADGDGRREVIARKRVRSQLDQRLQRFIWCDGRFVAWHAPEWSYIDAPETPTTTPDLTGLPLQEADQALKKAGFNLGLIAILDNPGPGGRVLRYERANGRAHVAIGAGDTRVSLPKLPPVAVVYAQSGFLEPGSAPIAVTEPQRTRWRDWLQQLAAGVQQAVYTSGPPDSPEPTYYVELAKPWSVKLGGRPQQIRWLGISTGVPHRGLIYLAEGQTETGHPRFTAAVYTTRSILPTPAPKE